MHVRSAKHLRQLFGQAEHTKVGSFVENSGQKKEHCSKVFFQTLTVAGNVNEQREHDADPLVA